MTQKRLRTRESDMNVKKKWGILLNNNSSIAGIILGLCTTYQTSFSTFRKDSNGSIAKITLIHVFADVIHRREQESVTLKMRAVRSSERSKHWSTTRRRQCFMIMHQQRRLLMMTSDLQRRLQHRHTSNYMCGKAHDIATRSCISNKNSRISRKQWMRVRSKE